MLYFAHSTPRQDRSDWQPLAEHLQNVGRVAGEFAAPFGASQIAAVAGLLHDLGKYTEDFQRRISGESLRVDHATWGAIVAHKRYGDLAHLVTYAIAGHHAGLANGIENGERTSLKERMRECALPPLSPDWQQDIQLPASLGDVPFKRGGTSEPCFQAAFLVRMLFSCLVDADYLDTESFYDKQAQPGQPADRASCAPSPDRPCRRCGTA